MIDTSGFAFPKPGIVRVEGKDMKLLRLTVFMRDGGRCVKCHRRVDFEGTSVVYPPMHLSHKRNKKNHGDTPENTETRCPDCHLIGQHNPKSVPPKGTL